MKKLGLLVTLVLLLVLFVACNKIECKIEFVVDNEIYSTVETNGNETIRIPADPTKNDCIFAGWYWDNNSWQRPFTANSLLNEPLSENLRVYAKWNDENALEGTQARFKGFIEINASTYSITVSNVIVLLNFSDIVEVNNKSSWKLTTDIQGNNAISSKIATLSVGDNTYYILVAAESESVKLYTLTIRRSPFHLVTFNDENGTAIDTQSIEEGCRVAIPTQVPTRTGYKFIDWNFDFDAAITAPIVITANWKANAYKITYHANNGTAESQEQNAIFNASVDLWDDTAFTKTYYTLIKWNTNADGTGMNYACGLNIADYDISDNLDLYAVWSISQYTISFDSDSGTAVNPITQEYNTAVTEPANPIKTGYEFVKWQLESVDYIFTTMPAKNITLTAVWSINQYTIAFNSGYGTKVDPITQDYATAVKKPENPTLTLYRFIEWQLDAIEYIFTTMPAKNIMLTAVWEPFSDGFGTKEFPYILKTATDLAFLATLVNSNNNFSLDKHFVLGDNINLSGMEWTPIGYMFSTFNNYTRAFQGSFDGNGYEISNFTVTKNSLVNSYYVYAGLFGYTYESIIENLGIVNFTTNISATSSIYAGGLAGCSSGTIENCYATGNVIAMSSYSIYAGGLVGYMYNDGTIKNCYATGNVSAISSYGVSVDAGGLAGYIYNGTIENCYATGNAIATATSNSGGFTIYANVGGLVGYNSGIIKNCYATGYVSANTSGFAAQSATAGGLAGNNRNTIESCYAAGNVSATAVSNAYVGGLVGFGYFTIKNCYRYAEQILSVASNNWSVICTLDDLNDIDFYITVLEWDSDIWKITNLDFENGKYPTLKHD